MFGGRREFTLRHAELKKGRKALFQHPARGSRGVSHRHAFRQGFLIERDGGAIPFRPKRYRAVFIGNIARARGGNRLAQMVGFVANLHFESGLRGTDGDLLVAAAHHRMKSHGGKGFERDRAECRVRGGDRDRIGCHQNVMPRRNQRRLQQIWFVRL